MALQNKDFLNKESSNKASIVAYIGIFSAFAIIISYLESLIPINIGIPGIKPGFANIVMVLAIYCINIKAALIINIIRILVVGIMFGNIFSIIFSLAGGMLSILVMFIVRRLNSFSIVGVSVCGGVAHNIGQIITASIVTTVYFASYYLPFMIAGGVITGVLVGILADIIYKRIFIKTDL